MIEGLLALDGRVARTLPNLMGRPGRITRDYLKGRRARYMPPFRLYIVASLIFFLLIPGIDQVSSSLSDGAAGFSDAVSQGQALRERADAEIEASLAAGDLTEEEAEQTRQALARLGLTPRPERDADGAEPANAPAAEAGRSGGDGEESGIIIGPGGDPDQIRRFFSPEDYGEAAPDSMFPLALRRFLGERFAQTAEDPGGYIEATQDWVPRIMFAMVPVYALLLSLTYAWRRRFFFFDHLIVSMHFHSALFLAMAAGLLIGGGGWAFGALLIYSNIYLYRLHRVVYGRGRFASVLRTLTLDVLYFVVLMFGLVAVLLLGALAG